MGPSNHWAGPQLRTTAGLQEVRVRVFRSLDELTAAVGEEIGPTDWLTVTQERVDTFADATGDHQWIHVDRARAASGPFGGTIAHGYLTLSLVPLMASQLLHIDTMGAKLNYGVNKVRFPHHVPVGSRIRATATIAEVTDVPAGKQMITRYVVEIEDVPKPACVAETVVLLLA
jgi:acyl dehydratase